MSNRTPASDKPLSWPTPAVRAIRSYYTFLAAELGAIPPESIVEPPVGGWPNISATSLASLGKTEEVIELLRHLPYIKAQNKQNEKIAYETRSIEYNGAYTQSCISKNLLNGAVTPIGAGEIPPHVAVLTYGARYGSWLLLDTQEGTVTDYVQQERPERDEPARDSPDFWRAYSTLPVDQFFEQWKQNFRSLEWVVNPFNVDDGMMLREDRETDEVREIYREHGWPHDFRREDCRRALLAWDDNH